MQINEAIFIAKCFSIKILFPERIDQKREKDRLPAVIIEAGAYKYAMLNNVPLKPFDKDCARNSLLKRNFNGFILNLYIDIKNKKMSKKIEVMIC